MPTGPSGQKRPADVIANAVHVARIATGGIPETDMNASRPNTDRKKMPLEEGSRTDGSTPSWGTASSPSSSGRGP